MIHRLLFIFIFATSPNLAQAFQISLDTLANVLRQLNSNQQEYDLQAIQNSLHACGQFNQQSSVTLISNQGLLLVSRAALLPYLPEEVDPDQGYWAKSSEEERPLKNSLVSFQLEVRDLTAEVLRGVEEVSEERRATLIARNRIQLKMKEPVAPGQNVQIRSRDQEQTFFLYKSVIYSDLRLVGLPATSDQESFAFIRIYPPQNLLVTNSLAGQKNLLNRSKIPLSTSASIEDSVVVYSIDFPEQSKWHSSSYELSLQIQSYEITLALKERLFNIYQQNGTAVPQKHHDQYQQAKYILAYLKQNDILSKKQALESQLMLDSDCRKSLEALRFAYRDLQDFHLLKSYAQDGFSQVQLYQLSSFLNRIQKNTPEQYVKMQPKVQQFLEEWQKEWNLVIDQALFTEMAEVYFSRTKAKYLSPTLIDYINITAKSYAELSSLIYDNTLLSRPADVRKLLQQDLATLQASLKKDIGYQFMRQFELDFQERLMQPARNNYRLIDGLQREFYKSKMALLQGKWVAEANGSQHFQLTKLLKEVDASFPSIQTFLPPLPGTDLAPILNTNGEALGFRLENSAKSLAYIWWIPKQDLARFPVVNSAHVLTYLARGPTGQNLLEEIKKAP